MANTVSSSSSSGIGFGGLLTITFVVLKLTHFIAWSWWWVLAPIWIPVGLLLAFIAFCLLMAILTGQWSKKAAS
jgi:hypothetical protein